MSANSVAFLLAAVAMFLAGAVVVVVSAGWLAELATLGACVILWLILWMVGRRRV
jgi:acyl-CoA synthetase (AMP-forming)/AMP-acid ligase II